MVAASAGMSNVVRLLIDAGADRNLRNKKRKTAADIAVATGHLVIAQMLK
jgi:ankyrin repeat protein